MLRLLHTSDWQLGMTRHFLNSDAHPRFDQERIDAVTRIASIADNEHCDLVVVAGDVFESNYLDRQYLLRCLEALRSFHVPVVLVPGNHDPSDPASIYTSRQFRSACPPQIVVAHDTTPLQFPDLECVIYPAPWPSKRVTMDLVTQACTAVRPDSARYRVVVGHGAVDTIVPSFDNPAAILLSDLEPYLTSSIVHYVALGDRHSRTEVGETGRCWYSGTPVVTDFDETEPNSVLLVDLADDGTVSLQTRETSQWRFIDLAADFIGRVSVDQLRERLDAIAHKHTVVLRLSLTGTLELMDYLQLEQILEDYHALFAGFTRWERRSDLTILPGEISSETLDLHGYAAQSLNALIAESSSPAEEASAALDAVALLYHLHGQLS